MSETLPPPLPPGIAALLDAERGREGLSDAARDRILERLESTLSGPRPRPRRRWRATLGAFAGGLFLGAALGGALLGARPGREQPRVLVLDPPPPPPPVVVVVRQAVPSVAAPLPPEPRTRTFAPRAERSPAGTPAQDHEMDEPDTELARERALIETARSALARKQPDVMEILVRHEQQFPEGRLAEERESLLVQALVRAGRAEEARRRAARFRARWPRSLLQPVLDAALGEIP